MTYMYKLSIIIATFNEEKTISKLLDQLRFSNDIILVDGGSTDNTIKIASEKNINIINCKKNRGLQFYNGAKAAKEDWLLFIHADSILSKDCQNSINKFIAKKNSAYVGWFNLSFDSDCICQS